MDGNVLISKSAITLNKGEVRMSSYHIFLIVIAALVWIAFGVCFLEFLDKDKNKSKRLSELLINPWFRSFVFILGPISYGAAYFYYIALLIFYAIPVGLIKLIKGELK